MIDRIPTCTCGYLYGHPGDCAPVPLKGAPLKLIDRYAKHLIARRDGDITDYDLVLAVDYEGHLWIKEQEEAAALTLLREAETKKTDEVEIAEDLIKWLGGDTLDGHVKR